MLPATSYAFIDQVLALPGLAERLELVVVGPKVAVVGDSRLTCFRACESAAFQPRVTGAAVVETVPVRRVIFGVVEKVGAVVSVTTVSAVVVACLLYTSPSPRD